MVKKAITGDASPEPETQYAPAEIIAGAQKALGVAPEVAAGALSGITEPITLTVARERVTAFLQKEVK